MSYCVFLIKYKRHTMISIYKDYIELRENVNNWRNLNKEKQSRNAKGASNVFVLLILEMTNRSCKYHLGL